MSRSPYDPPIAPVIDPVLTGVKRRWWLLVPVVYSALTFLWMLAWWWLRQPAKSGSLNFSLDPGALRFIAREALYQGGVVVVVTGFSITLLPRIHWRHAIYVSLASMLAATAANLAVVHIRGQITNGEHLLGMILTYVVVLLITREFISGSQSMSPGA